MVADSAILAGMGGGIPANQQSGARIAALGLARNAKPMTEDQAAKAAKDFESLFIGQMLEQMFGESLGDDLFGDSDTQEVYKGLMMDAYGKEISKSGGIGIASYVTRELLKLQEI